MGYLCPMKYATLSSKRENAVPQWAFELIDFELMAKKLEFKRLYAKD
jgi:hypothetical protein